jgi:two-component system cell cycle sensor histidine kinase PleC
MPILSKRSSPRQMIAARVAASVRDLRNAWNTIRLSVSPTPAEAWQTDAQLRLMRSGTRSSTLMIPFAAFFVALAFAPWVGSLRRNAWWIGLSILCIAIDQINRRIDHIAGRDAETVARKARLSVAISILFYAGWSSMSVVFWVPDQPVAQMLLVLILACSLAGSTVICAAHPATAFSALVIESAFLIGPTALGGSTLDVTLSALSAVFILLVTGQLIGLSTGMQRLLMLEHERSDVVQSLRAAKQESDRERGLAAAAGRAKSQFLSNMNHELRTPMNAILGFSELIKSKAFGDAADKYAEYAGIIHDSGQQLLGLIDGMLDLAKIEGGRLSLREADVSLALLISDTVEQHEEAARSARLTLSCQIQQGFPQVFADERGLRQILSNLLSNAINFTLPDGRITVFARVDPDGRLAFGVEDTGMGIAKEDQAHVFERFGKRRHDVMVHNKGVGLGLAIVKGFAEAHDGSVKLESDVGAGTRVTVYLPKDRLLERTGAMRAAG